MAGALLCILLELYFLAPAAMGIWHVGMLYPMVPLTLLSVWLSCPRLFDRLPRWLCRAGAAVVGAGAAFNYCQFTSIKKSQNFFQMRFIENLSFALKNGFKKFFSKVAV